MTPFNCTYNYVYCKVARNTSQKSENSIQKYALKNSSVQSSGGILVSHSGIVTPRLDKNK